MHTWLWTWCIPVQNLAWMTFNILSNYQLNLVIIRDITRFSISIKVCIKWRIFSQPGKLGSGKNLKIWIFSTGLQVHLEHIFWVLKLFVKFLSWAEQSGTQFFRLSNLLLVYKSGPANSIQIFDIWWLSLDINDDFKLISRTSFFRFGEINKSLFWVLSKCQKTFFLLWLEI